MGRHHRDPKNLLTSRVPKLFRQLRLRSRLIGKCSSQKGRQTRPADDRRHAPEGSPDRRQPAQKVAVPRRIGRTKGGLNSKLHAVCDGQGRPLVMLLSEGQMSDYKGAAQMLPALPKAKTLLCD